MKAPQEQAPGVLALALPILVVPDGTLWRTLYGEDGARIEDPHPMERASVYVGKDYSLGVLNGTDLTISHVEIMTESGLRELVRQSLLSADAMNSTFFANAAPPKPS